MICSYTSWCCIHIYALIFRCVLALIWLNIFLYLSCDSVLYLLMLQPFSSPVNCSLLNVCHIVFLTQMHPYICILPLLLPHMVTWCFLLWGLCVYPLIDADLDFTASIKRTDPSGCSVSAPFGRQCKLHLYVWVLYLSVIMSRPSERRCRWMSVSWMWNIRLKYIYVQ